MIQLTLDPEGETVTLALTAYLGDSFAAYRDACRSHGARFVKSIKANRAPVEAVPGLLRALADAGLPVEVDQAVADRIAEQAAQANELLEAGRARLERVEAQLAERGEALYPFQRTGVEWLAPRTGALLADDMGLGKTVQALLSIPDKGAALVVCPAAVRYSWESECARWRPDLRPVVIASSKAFRWPEAGELVISTYGLLPEEPPGLAAPGTVLVADEAHLLKGSKTKRTKRWRSLLAEIRRAQGAVWLLTGTPLLNRPPELWNVLRAAGIAEQAFGSWPQFVRLFDGCKSRFGYEWGTPSEEVPDLLRRVMLHRRREEVLPDLPRKTRRTVEVNGLDARTRKLCDAVLGALAEAGIDLDRAVEEAEATKIEGAAFEELSAARAALATAKIPALLELVESYEESEEPLVVFSAHRAPVEALGARAGWATITGSTSPEERGRIVEDFQAGRLRGVAGTIAAMGVGVTLTHAHHLILVDLAWTPALNCQAEDRICRIGQTRGVVITRLVARHALDRRVSELLTRKQEIIEASVEAAAVEADYLGESPAEELASAAESAAEAVADVEALRVQAEREREERARQALQETKQRLGDKWDGRALRISGKFRSAANPVEEHAARAMVQLADLDTDHASVINDAGFSQFDNDFGHSLADRIRERGMLSDKQWAAACRLARRYKRQVGEPKELAR